MQRCCVCSIFRSLPNWLVLQERPQRHKTVSLTRARDGGVVNSASCIFVGYFFVFWFACFSNTGRGGGSRSRQKEEWKGSCFFICRTRWWHFLPLFSRTWSLSRSAALLPVYARGFVRVRAHVGEYCRGRNFARVCWNVRARSRGVCTFETVRVRGSENLRVGCVQPAKQLHLNAVWFVSCTNQCFFRPISRHGNL